MSPRVEARLDVGAGPRRRTVARRASVPPTSGAIDGTSLPTTAVEARRRRSMRARSLFVCSLLVASAIVVGARAYRLQIVDGPRYRATAERQHVRDLPLAPRRGTIYDRHGAELAVSVDADSVHANPRLMRSEGVDAVVAARRLAQVLGIDAERLGARLATDRPFVWVERQVTPEEAAAVRALAIPGVAVTREARRYYPNRELAAHILGFANVDGEGIEGIELSLDERLRGERTRVPVERDRRGRIVYSEAWLGDRPSVGANVHLTIDKTLQHIAERELALSVRTFEAAAGSIVVLAPQSGEILAMASYPTFDPNAPAEAPPSHRRFRAITDRFEPGSTIKPITIASALAAGVLRPDEQIDCHEGRWVVVEGERPITDTHPWGLLTPAEILAHSSNIGSAQIGMRLGRQGLYRAFRRFGFGQPTGIPLPGEVGGTFRHHARWYERDFASVGFGQGLSVTALQLATAMAVIANGGRLVRPLLVRRIEDGAGHVLEESTPEIRRQVIPPETARLVADMLTAVTSTEGTGAEAAIDGYLVAGKTGTAQMASVDGRGYSQDRWLASFVGFVPAEAPRAVIAVIIQEPVIDHYGGVVAGPVFRRVGAATMRHLGVPPAGSAGALEGLEARARSRGRSARARSEALEGALATSNETGGARAADGADRAPSDAGVRIPDLRGQTARTVLRTLAAVGLSAEVEGSGLAASQAPAPGSFVPRGSHVRVLLERPSSVEADGPPSEPETERGVPDDEAPPPQERRERGSP